jgi:hypothetical protein
MGVTVSERPPNLPIVISNVNINTNIDQDDKRIIELTKRYGIVDVERM